MEGPVTIASASPGGKRRTISAGGTGADDDNPGLQALARHQDGTRVRLEHVGVQRIDERLDHARDGLLP